MVEDERHPRSAPDLVLTAELAAALPPAGRRPSCLSASLKLLDVATAFRRSCSVQPGRLGTNVCSHPARTECRARRTGEQGFEPRTCGPKPHVLPTTPL